MGNVDEFDHIEPPLTGLVFGNELLPHLRAEQPRQPKLAQTTLLTQLA